VDEKTRHVAAAAAWGLFPERDATYLNYSGNHDIKVGHRATYKVPENEAFWSITVYGKDGFMKSENCILNSSNVKLNQDGTFTVYFGSKECAVTCRTDWTSPMGGTSSCGCTAPGPPSWTAPTSCRGPNGCRRRGPARRPAGSGRGAAPDGQPRRRSTPRGDARAKGGMRPGRGVATVASACTGRTLEIPRPARLAKQRAIVPRPPGAGFDAADYTFAKALVLLDARLAREPIASAELQAIQVGPAVFLFSPAEYFVDQPGLVVAAVVGHGSLRPELD
jgi:hypothetical protein